MGSPVLLDFEAPALAACEELAPFYDEFTAGYDYERWLSALEALAVEHGLRLFGRDSVRESDERVFCWRGDPRADAGEGERFAAAIDVFSPEADGRFARAVSRHEQRHHPRADIEAGLADAGLELVAVRGQAVGARLEPEPDEDRHQKLVYLARMPA